jgi:hypothetical protein
MPQKQTPEQFFYEHAGYSYDPKKETPEQGRRKCARALARAEAKAYDKGITYKWDVDDTDSSEWSDERPAWQQWYCIAYNRKGAAIASLSGIDFGRNGEPWGDPYRRVVEAELALEAI